MSSFFCEKCGTPIVDTPQGYTTGCAHYPLEHRKKVHCEPKPKVSHQPPDLDSELDEDYGDQ